MFILPQKAFQDSDSKNIHEFVKSWSHFYKYSRKDLSGKRICYLDELCLGADIKLENLRNLLRWKSSRFLSGKTSDSKAKIGQIEKGLDTLNAFRRDDVLVEFSKWASDVYPDDKRVVLRAFLFHIARPTEYPIWDQHVARTFAVLRGRAFCVDWANYADYRNWFADLKTALGSGETRTVSDMREIKRLDSALMVYGQFLAKYSASVPKSRQPNG